MWRQIFRIKQVYIGKGPLYIGAAEVLRGTQQSPVTASFNGHACYRRQSQIRTLIFSFGCGVGLLRGAMAPKLGPEHKKSCRAIA
jgi:hypothetical protein